MKPEHYDSGKDFDVIDFATAYHLNFNRGSVVKYVARAGNKKYDNLDVYQSEIKDLKKAIDFLQRELKTLEDE